MFVYFFFENMSRKIQVSLKSDRNLHEDKYAFMVVSRSLIPRMRNVLEFVEKIKRLCSVFFFLRKSRRSWDVKKKIVKSCYDRWHGACALHAGKPRLQTHAWNMKYFLVFLPLQWLRPRASCVLRTLPIMLMYKMNSGERSVLCADGLRGGNASFARSS